MAKIFDPFFTTKFTGLSLGLAAVAGIVRTHKGAVKVDSRPSVSIRFQIFFPALATKPSPASPIKPQSTPSTVEEKVTIMVVDDEEQVRTVFCKGLMRSGYETLSAEDGFKALKWIQSNPVSADIIILDLTMPNMSGKET